MNQARSTYQTDYTPFDWLQNNIVSDMNEFCSLDNIDECLKYISQEFCALGYPSIYCNNSDCAFAVNCDIVKFLNATFELLRSFNGHSQIKEDLEDRNQRLSADLNVLSKKNSHMKNTLEQNERKLSSALERERQLKEKNEQLSQLLKSEKDETKKLSAQIRQLKVTHQHEFKKYENNMNHVKAKINQLLSDKNPNKRITNISTSHNLARNTGQRGKWKTGSSATSAVEEMYNSVISSYEIRCKDMCKEINLFRQCLQSVLLQIVETVTDLKDGVDGNDCFPNEFLLNEITNESRNCQDFDEKFKYLFSVLKEATKKSSENCRNLETQINILKFKVSEHEKHPENDVESLMFQNVESQKSPINAHLEREKEELIKSLSEELMKKEKLKLEEEKEAFLKSLEKEKAELSSQKLAFLRLAVQQKKSPSSWHHSLSTFPSISVITSHKGASRISSAGELKYFSSPEQSGQSPSSFWMSPVESSSDKLLQSKSDSVLVGENSSGYQSSVCSPASDLNFSNSDLPSWAAKKSEVQTIVISETPKKSQTIQNTSSDNLEPLNESSSEEINLLRLKAAVQDIEQRRTNIS